MLSGMSGTPYTPPVTRRTVRLTAIVTGVVAVVALLVGLLVGQAGWALFGILGLLLGLVNNVLGVLSVTSFATTHPSKMRFAGSVLARLAAISVLAFGCALLFRPPGFGVFAGLVVFQFLALVSSMPPLIKEVRRG